MSAFIVEDTTINNVVNWLHSEKFNNGSGAFPTYGRCCKLLEDSGYNLNEGTSYGEDKEFKRLAEDMFVLNKLAVEDKYDNKTMNEMSSNGFKYENANSMTTIYQVLKSLHCWHYQCCEGNIPKQSNLYKTMDKVSEIMADVIINSLPQYEKAVWG